MATKEGFVGSEKLALRGYDAAAEKEAGWLAGPLLLPREKLVRAHLQRASDQVICQRYGVSN